MAAQDEEQNTPNSKNGGTPASKPLVAGRRDWQPHQPDTVDVIGNPQQKNNTNKTLHIDGMEGAYSPKEAYILAKQEGNKAAAYAYARHLVDSNPDIISGIIEKYGAERPVIVPVDAIEYTNGSETKYNSIARAFANILAEKTGWELNGSDGRDAIYQSNKVGRTGAPQLRFERNPTFEGAVEPKRNYFIVDDHFYNGGTMRSLMDHIERHDGKVVGASTLINGHFGAQLKPSIEDINHTKALLGEENYNALHKKIFGVEGSHNLFTHGELEAFKTISQQIAKKHTSSNTKADTVTLQNELYERVNHELESTSRSEKRNPVTEPADRSLDGRGERGPATRNSGSERTISQAGAENHFQPTAEISRGDAEHQKPAANEEVLPVERQKQQMQAQAAQQSIPGATYQGNQPQRQQQPQFQHTPRTDEKITQAAQQRAGMPVTPTAPVDAVQAVPAKNPANQSVSQSNGTSEVQSKPVVKENAGISAAELKRGGVVGAATAGATEFAMALAKGEGVAGAAVKAQDAMIPGAEAYRLALAGKTKEAVASGVGEAGSMVGAALGGAICAAPLVEAPPLALAAGLFCGGIGSKLGKQGFEAAASLMGFLKSGEEVHADSMKITPTRATYVQGQKTPSQIAGK